MNNNTTSSSSTASNTTPQKPKDSDEPLDGASCSASSLLCDAVITPSEEERRKIIVIWQNVDGEVEDTTVDLETDLELIRQWKNAGRKARFVTGIDLNLVIKYPETFNLLVDTNR